MKKKNKTKEKKNKWGNIIVLNGNLYSTVTG